MSDSDLIDVVDENDKIVDVKSRWEVREKVLTYRGVNVILLNSKNEVYVHQRSFSKKSYGGYWSIFFGGFVDHGEIYLISALRELEEESGIKVDELKFVGDFRYNVSDDDWFGKLYVLRSDDDIKIQEEEIEKGCFISLEDLDSFVLKHDLKPSDKYIYEKFKSLILGDL